jgi:hypothetical protein
MLVTDKNNKIEAAEMCFFESNGEITRECKCKKG